MIHDSHHLRPDPPPSFPLLALKRSCSLLLRAAILLEERIRVEKVGHVVGLLPGLQFAKCLRNLGANGAANDLASWNTGREVEPA